VVGGWFFLGNNETKPACWGVVEPVKVYKCPEGRRDVMRCPEGRSQRESEMFRRTLSGCVVWKKRRGKEVWNEEIY
jgi:hypothetical protein